MRDSMMFCDHANEMPNVCPCPWDCPCRVHGECAAKYASQGDDWYGQRVPCDPNSKGGHSWSGWRREGWRICLRCGARQRIADRMAEESNAPRELSRLANFLDGRQVAVGNPASAGPVDRAIHRIKQLDAERGEHKLEVGRVREDRYALEKAMESLGEVVDWDPESHASPAEVAAGRILELENDNRELRGRILDLEESLTSYKPEQDWHKLKLIMVTVAVFILGVLGVLLALNVGAYLLGSFHAAAGVVTSCVVATIYTATIFKRK